MDRTAEKTNGTLPFNPLVQALAPSARRMVQELAVRHGLKTGLDAGCGQHSILSPLRPNGFHSTGLEADAGMLEQAKAGNAHDEYIAADFLDFTTDRTFDIVVMSHIIEHFDRETGFAVIRKAEKLAARLVYIETPKGFRPQGSLDGNSFQRHLSGWLPADFAMRGYNVFGSGIAGFRGEAGRARLLPEYATRILERVTRLMLFRFPRLSGTICAVRFTGEDGSPLKL